MALLSEIEARITTAKNHRQPPEASANRSPVLTSVSNMPKMEVVLHLPCSDAGQYWGLGRRGDPGEWQNPTASPHGHDEDDDETLLHAGKGTLFQIFPVIFANATTASLCMQPPNLARLFKRGVYTPGICSFTSAKPHCCTKVILTTPSYIICDP